MCSALIAFLSASSVLQRRGGVRDYKFPYYYFLYIEHPACIIFAQCESNQSVVDFLPRLAILLYKEKIIAEMVIPTAEEASVLLKAVKEAVCADYRNLKKFAAILKKLESQPVISMAFSLLEDYSEFT